jgi:cytochrome c biogenesis protein
VPRLRRHLAALVARPPDAPARLDRLPQHDRREVPADVAAELHRRLRGRRWRVVRREHPDGTVTVAAEKGYLKETGNLVFHFALLALLIGVGAGAWYGWHGNRLLVAGPESGFCNTPQQYDEYALGPRVGPADLPPFCVRLAGFHATYLDNGQPTDFIADVSWVEGLDGAQHRTRLRVNHPLRLDGANVHLFGHGYAMVLRYTDRLGVTQTTVAPFLPDDALLTSSGVAAFPDANTDPTGGRPRDPDAQVGFAGVYLPTAPDDPTLARSTFPDERDPALMLVAYVGDLGLGSGAPQSVYELNQAQLDAGLLRQVDRRTLRPGQDWTLPDGSRLEFLGTRPWVTVSVRHDPGEVVVLGGAVALVTGLVASLAGRRRRLWARVSPAGDGRSLVSLGGLARDGGFGAEFATTVDAITERRPTGGNTDG